ncbi:chromosome partitioning protein ParA [Brevundimonas sp. AAP58]|uniref:ParA family protein n=1 Tax=Brevundimonas sp. AAP58 TaxID=1523422 RepID=UPI0006B91768|nr:ParA family protein [Brevundimonas sp. AAP58]KPF75584.1 chromosome partitioning protein ParA [Brevundimonas sp. AAP58]
MPTIVFVSPKGGVGKTTAALVLATQIAKAARVTVIDADPNHPIAAWSKEAELPDNLSVVADADEDNIIEKIEEAASASPFVIVDLEGTAAKIVLLAVSQADFVVIPTQGSQLDAEQASRAIRVVKQQEKMSGRATPFGVLLTRTSPIIRTRTMGHIQHGLEDAGIPVLKAQLHEREAFRAMFSFRRTLETLNPKDVPNLDKAVANAAQIAAEIIEKLREGRGGTSTRTKEVAA